MDGTHAYNTRSNHSEKRKHFPEEVNPTGKFYRTGVPTLEASSTADPMQLLQQALAVLTTTTSEGKVARQRVEEMSHEREELRLEAEMKYREFELSRMTKWEHAEQERQVRMTEMENDNMEHLRQAEERRAAETEVREASKKKKLILQMLQKQDDLTDPDAYFIAF